MKACHTYADDAVHQMDADYDGQSIIAESSYSHNYRKRQYGRGRQSYPVLTFVAAGVQRRTTGRSTLVDLRILQTSLIQGSKVNVQLDGPLPLAVDDVVVEPHRPGQETDVLSKVVIHPESSTTNVILPAGVIGRAHPLVVLIARLVLDRPEAIVIADHAARVGARATLTGQALQT